MRKSLGLYEPQRRSESEGPPLGGLRCDPDRPRPPGATPARLVGRVPEAELERTR